MGREIRASASEILLVCLRSAPPAVVLSRAPKLLRPFFPYSGGCSPVSTGSGPLRRASVRFGRRRRISSLLSPGGAPLPCTPASGHPSSSPLLAGRPDPALPVMPPRDVWPCPPASAALRSSSTYFIAVAQPSGFASHFRRPPQPRPPQPLTAGPHLHSPASSSAPQPSPIPPQPLHTTTEPTPLRSYEDIFVIHADLGNALCTPILSSPSLRPFWHCHGLR